MNNSSSPLPPSLIEEQIRFTKRPLLYMNRLLSMMKSSGGSGSGGGVVAVLCGVLLLAGCDVLVWMMIISCMIVTCFILYGVSLMIQRKRKVNGALDLSLVERIDWLNQVLGSDISLIDDALREVVGKKNESKERIDLIVVGVGLGSVLHRLEQESELFNQFESIKVLEPNETIVKTCQEKTSQKIEYLSCDYAELSKYSADIVLLQVEYLRHLDQESISSLIRTSRNMARVGLIIGDLQRSNFIDMFSLLGGDCNSCVSTHDLFTMKEWYHYLDREIQVETNQISSIWTFGRITLIIMSENN